MLLLFGKYKIASYYGGYKISKMKGNQWKVISYHDTLRRAIEELFRLKIVLDTKDFIVDFEDEIKFESQKNALLKRIEEIKQELIGKIGGAK